MKIKGENLAPATLIELILHYTRKEGLYDKEIKRVLFVDDAHYPDGIYSSEKKTLVLNFGTMSEMIPAFGFDMLDRVPAIWAVQIAVTLAKIRAAIQVKNGSAAELSKRARVQDAYEWVYVEMLRLVGLNHDLYMPSKLDEMGIMGRRLKTQLAVEYRRGGARIDAAGLQVKGAVEFNRLWKSLTHESMKYLKKMRDDEEIEFGRESGLHFFLSFYEWFTCCYDDLNVQKAARKLANQRMTEYAQRQLQFSSEREQAKEEEGETAVAPSAVLGG